MSAIWPTGGVSGTHKCCEFRGSLQHLGEFHSATITTSFSSLQASVLSTGVTSTIEPSRMGG